MSHPQELTWDDEALDFFERRISSHHGDVLEAIGLIKKYIICINNDGQIKYTRNQKNIVITNMTEFENIILEELEDEKYYVMDFINNWMKNKA